MADELIDKWFELLTTVPLDEIRLMIEKVAKGEMNPNEAKHLLAIDIVSQYYGAAAAEAAAQKEREVHSGNAIPSDAVECSLSSNTYGVLDLLVAVGAFASKGEARRMLQNGGVKLNSEKISDPQMNINIAGNDALLVQIGKRKFFKVNF